MDDRTILEYACRLMPAFQQLFAIDCNMSVSDRDRFIYFLNGREFVLEDNFVGTDVPPEDPQYEAMHKRKVCDVEVGKEVYGIAHKARGVPLYNENGDIIGSLGIGISLANQETLLGVVDSVAAASQQISSTCDGLVQAAEKLAEKQEELSALGQKIYMRVQNTDGILNFINEVARTSNLLGLNASIEAARIGLEGRAFSVVADEIRRMAMNSKKSVNDIKEILEEIKAAVKDMSDKIVDATSIARNQASVTLEITTSIQSLADSVYGIREVAKII
jgi:hypothetical protein